MNPKKTRLKVGSKKHTDANLDRALEDTFPASDPVSLIEPAHNEPDSKFKKKSGGPSRKKGTSR